MKRINVILKATEGCNLRCRYCYNCDSHYSDEILPQEKLDKLLRLLAASYESITIIWHGGEPLMCGLDYFKEAVERELRIFRETGSVFSNSVQTNATFIERKWISFFKKYQFKVGVSFDGLHNSDYRQRTERVLEAIRLMKRKRMQFGCLAVVADDEYDMLENYKFFAENGLHFALSPMFTEGGAETLQPLSAESFIRKTNELFDYWIRDTKGVNVRVFTDYISMMFGGHTKTCTNGSCHGRWLGVTPDGNVYNCGRDSMKQYCFGNIDDAESAEDFFGSDGFRRLLIGAIARRKACKENCPYFPFCESGCSDCAITENGLENVPGFSCECFRGIFGYVTDRFRQMMAEKTPLSSMNPAVRTVALRCMSERS